MNNISDPQILHDKLLKLGFKETTYDELMGWEQYGIKYDKDLKSIDVIVPCTLFHQIGEHVFFKTRIFFYKLL